MHWDGILAPERAAGSSHDDPTPVARLLRLFCRDRPQCLALVGAGIDGRLRIEDASQGVRSGTFLSVPVDLLSGHGAVLDVSRERLSTGWIELCGSRPEYLAAAPIANHPLQLVVSGRGPPPRLSELLDASILIGSILDRDPLTRRARDASLRMVALIDNLPVPIVFVDARTIEVFSTIVRAGFY